MLGMYLCVYFNKPNDLFKCRHFSLYAMHTISLFYKSICIIFRKKPLISILSLNNILKKMFTRFF